MARTKQRAGPAVQPPGGALGTGGGGGGGLSLPAGVRPQDLVGLPVHKVFPRAHPTKLWKGHVASVEVDEDGTDDRYYELLYEDGDSEWVNLAELVRIAVRSTIIGSAAHGFAQLLPAAKEAGQARGGGGGGNSISSTSSSSSESESEQEDDLADAAGVGRKRRQRQQRQAPGGAKQQQQQQQEEEEEEEAAAAAPGSSGRRAAKGGASRGGRGGSGGSGRGRRTRQQQPAAAAAAAAGSAGEGPSSAEVLRAVLAGADAQAAQAAQQRAFLRLPAAPLPAGAGVALPAHSQAVVTGAAVHVALYGEAVVGRGYEAEARALLQALDAALERAGSSKGRLVRVAAYLRSVDEGLHGFRAAWDAWAPPASLPVLLVLQASGPATSRVVLDVTAATAAV